MEPDREPSVQPITEDDANLKAPVRASRTRRFGTLVVDQLGMLLFGLLTAMLIGLIFGDRGVAAVESIPDLAFGIILFVAYYIFFEGFWARTPGKFIFGTIVVTNSGAKPALRQVLERTACRLIPFEPLSFVASPSGWHDSLSRTRVVLRTSLGAAPTPLKAGSETG